MTIKLHLDEAESAPIQRLADILCVKPEDIVYAAVNRLMLRARDLDVQTTSCSSAMRGTKTCRFGPTPPARCTTTKAWPPANRRRASILCDGPHVSRREGR